MNDIEKARTRNNKNWMDILRLSIKLTLIKRLLIKEIYKEMRKYLN